MDVLSLLIGITCFFLEFEFVVIYAGQPFVPPGASPYPVQPGTYPPAPTTAYPPYPPGRPCEYLAALFIINIDCVCSTDVRKLFTNKQWVDFLWCRHVSDIKADHEKYAHCFCMRNIARIHGAWLTEADDTNWSSCYH